MTKLRTKTINHTHQQLYSASVDWKNINSNWLRVYLFHHGVKHGLLVGELSGVQQLLLAFGYGMGRLATCGSVDVVDFIGDLKATSILTGNQELEDWRLFLQTNLHLFNLETIDWGCDRILLQRALEYSVQSVITQRAIAWKTEQVPDWVVYKRTRIPLDVPVNPCVHTLLTDEEEWSCFDEWNGLVVAQDCCSHLWVCDVQNNQVLLHLEVFGYRLTPTHILLWENHKVYLWGPQDDSPDVVGTIEGETIGYCRSLSDTELLVVTEESSVYLLNILTQEWRQLLTFEDHRWLSVDVVSENMILVHQSGWHEVWDEDEEDYDEDSEWEASEEEESQESEGAHVDVDQDEGSEEWEASEEEEEAPSDPTIWKLSRSDTDPAVFTPEVLYVVEDGVRVLKYHQTNCLIVDKLGVIHLVGLEDCLLKHQWNLFEGSGADLYFSGNHQVAVFQWENQDSAFHILDTIGSFSAKRLEGHTDLVSGACFIDDQILVSTSFDATARVWDVQTGKCRGVIHNLVPHELSGVIWITESVVGIWSVSGHILIWDVGQLSHLGTLMGHTSSVSAVVKLSTGLIASTGMFEPSLRIWDWRKAPLRPPLDNHDDVVISDVLHQSGKILTAAHDKTLRVWDLETATCDQVFSEHTAPIECMQWMDDGTIISADWDGVIIHWEQDGEVLHRFEGHINWVRGLEVLGETNILSWSDDQTLRLWDLDTETCRIVLAGHQGPIRGGLLLSDSRWLSWSEDATLRVWDLAQGICLHTLEGHSNYVRKAFLHHPNTVLSYNYEDLDIPCEVKVWNVETGECLQTFTGLEAEVITLHWVDQTLYVRTYADCYRWSWDKPDAPVKWLLAEFAAEFPEIWEHLRNPSERCFEDSSSSVIVTENQITIHHHQQTAHWFADGNWRVHQGFTDGSVVATCWNDVVFLKR